MHAPVPHQPVRPPRSGQPMPRHDVPDSELDAAEAPSQGLFGELVPPPKPDWDWAPDNERRGR